MSQGAIKETPDGTTWRTAGHLVQVVADPTGLARLAIGAEDGQTVFCMSEDTLYVYKAGAARHVPVGGSNLDFSFLFPGGVKPIGWLPQPFPKGRVVEHQGGYWIAEQDATWTDTPGVDSVWFPLTLPTLHDVTFKRPTSKGRILVSEDPGQKPDWLDLGVDNTILEMRGGSPSWQERPARKTVNILHFNDPVNDNGVVRYATIPANVSQAHLSAHFFRGTPLFYVRDSGNATILSSRTKHDGTTEHDRAVNFQDYRSFFGAGQTKIGGQHTLSVDIMRLWTWTIYYFRGFYVADPDAFGDAGEWWEYHGRIICDNSSFGIGTFAAEPGHLGVYCEGYADW